MNTSLRAIVIGSGVAGLAGAIRLAIQGIDVTVLEKNSYPGGKLSHFELNGFHFDTGPSLFTQPENIEELFELAGEKIGGCFQYERLPVACKYFFEDGVVINAYADAENFSKELLKQIGEDAMMVRKYLANSEKLYKKAGSIFLNHSLHKPLLIITASLKALGVAKWKHIFHSLDDLNMASFKKPHTVQLFNRYATYNGSNPFQAPGMLSVIPHLEYNEGVFYPKGGMISITNALYNLALKKGVKFQFNSTAERIMRSEEKVSGVEVSKKVFNADIVVSNTDVYFTYKYLLNDEVKARGLLRNERSSSALVFYWGMSSAFPELQLHNIFFSRNYKAEFDHIFKLKILPDDPTIYINITSKMEPGKHAPKGKENWFVMVNAPANSGQDWNTFKRQCRAKVLLKLNRILETSVEAFIEAEKILDPVMIESETGSFMGSLYGSSSNSRMAAFLRHPNFSKEIKGLYFAGGSVHPGGGIPLCLKSAKIMSDIVAVDIKKRKV